MRTPTTSIGLAVSNRPDSDPDTRSEDCEKGIGKEHSDSTMPETIQTYHPTFEKTKKLFNLRKRLWEIADSKSDGTISYEEANHLAVDAVATANGGMPRATSGPMVRLCNLCTNGWIREAANEMGLVYPDLDYPERWGKHRDHRRKKERKATV